MVHVENNHAVVPLVYAIAHALRTTTCAPQAFERLSQQGTNSPRPLT